MADTKQIDWGDGSGEMITVTAASFVGDKGLQISSPENVKVTPRSKTIVLTSEKDPTKVARINVTQEKAVYTYDFSIAASVANIAAKGGTSTITAQLKTYRNGNLVSTETVTPVLSGTATGFAISGTTVTASNRTTVVGDERSITVTGKYSGTYDGQEVSATVVVKQEANSVTYGDLVGGSASASDIPASGGTSTTTVVNATQTVSFTSGSTRAGTVTYTQSSEISGSNLGTTIKSRTKLGTIEVVFTGEGGKTGVAYCDVYQQANSIDSYNYGSWSIAISANPTDIAYGGGTSTISASCTRSKTPVYTSGATGTEETESATPTLSGSATGFTLSGTTVTASANSWAASRSIVVTASYSGATSKSVTITQSAAPASISLNKTVLAFTQRAASDTVQVTCNSDWDIDSNAEFEIPDTLQIKYNPNTDIVELVDQPYQITKKVQESDDYVLALVRIGAYEPTFGSRDYAISREEVRDAKNSAAYQNRNQLFLLTKTQDKSYHRIVGRQWFRDGDATSQIYYGRKGQASLYTADMLITKPGKVVGIRGCELSIPRLKLATAIVGVITAASVSWNAKTGRITFMSYAEVDTGSNSQPLMSMVAQTSNNGPIGYILFKKKSTTQYLDVHGWEEVSNFTLARVLIDNNFTVKQSGSQFAVTVVFKYGED